MVVPGASRKVSECSDEAGIATNDSTRSELGKRRAKSSDSSPALPPPSPPFSSPQNHQTITADSPCTGAAFRGSTATNKPFSANFKDELDPVLRLKRGPTQCAA